MDILDRIIDAKRKRLEYSKGAVSIHELKSRLPDMDGTRDFRRAIKRDNGNIKLIAEIKKASPLKGRLREAFDLKQIASIYEEKPVSAISVLTEEDFFQGDLKYLRHVKNIVTKPVLRKDFIFDEYQLYEARANGADAILLIAAILGRNQAEDFLHLSRELGLYVLFETHDEEDLEKAIFINSDIIGINNRNLKTMQIDLSTTITLKKQIPRGKIVVSESGINDKADAVKLEAAGIDAMLIGTALMKAKDIGAMIDELILH